MAYVRFASDKRATPNYSSADESSMSSFIDDAEQREMASSDSKENILSDDGQEDVRVTRSMTKKKDHTRKARRQHRARPSAASNSRSPSSNSDIIMTETSATNGVHNRRRSRVVLLSSQEGCNTPTTLKESERIRVSSSRGRSAKFALSDSDEDKVSPSKKTRPSPIILSDDSEPEDERRSSKIALSSDSDEDKVSLSKRTRHSPIILSDDSEPENEPSGNKQEIPSSIAVNEADDADEPVDPSYPKCAICDKRYTFSIDHRAVSLKCGHFFGKPCIKKWLTAQRSCPTCRGAAAIDDLREHRGDTIKEDAREECLALEKLNKNQSKEIRRLQQDKKKLSENNDKLADENEKLHKNLNRKVAKIIRLQRELDDVHMITQNQLQMNAQRSGKILLRPSGKHHFVAGFDARARAFDFDGESFAVGYRTRADVFSIQTAAWRDQKYVPECKSEPFHEEQPRFVIFSPADSTVVLSGGEDKKAIVHKSGSPKDTKKFDIPNGVSAWSGCWLSKDEIAIGCGDGRVFKFSLTESHQAPDDLTAGFRHSPVIFLELDKRTGGLLVGTIKEVYAILGSSMLVLLTCEEHEKIRSIAYHSDSSRLAVTFRQENGTNHKLYELNVIKGKTDVKSIEAEEVAEWQTQCIVNSTLWSNCLLSFENDVAFVAFNEDDSRLVVHDFFGHRSDVYVPFNTKDLGNPTMMKVLESDEMTQLVCVLSSKGITNFTVELG